MNKNSWPGQKERPLANQHDRMFVLHWTYIEIEIEMETGDWGLD